MRKNNKTLKFYVVALCLLSSACTSSKLKKQYSESSSDTTQTSAINKQLHSHIVDKCNEIIRHSHSNFEKEHQHPFTCKKVILPVSNAHSHPATKLNKFFRHVHPNGANKHSHHKK